MDELLIKKMYSNNEIIQYGQDRIDSIKKKNMIVSIVFFVISCFLILTSTIVLVSDDAIDVYDILIALFLFDFPFLIPTICIFCIGNKKRDAYEYGLINICHKPDSMRNGYKLTVLSKTNNSFFIIDSQTNDFQFRINNKFSRIFSQEELIGFEISVDNEVIVEYTTKTKKGVGKALVGGMLLGGAGLVAGAAAGNSKSRTTGKQREIHHYKLILMLNDLKKPSYILDLDSIEVVGNIKAVLSMIVKGNEREEKAAVKDKTDDKFEEIKKYKELLDSGIISQEEFDNKKKELL